MMAKSSIRKKELYTMLERHHVDFEVILDPTRAAMP